jgi:hypothetical protein
LKQWAQVGVVDRGNNMVGILSSLCNSNPRMSLCQVAVGAGGKTIIFILQTPGVWQMDTWMEFSRVKKILHFHHFIISLLTSDSQ